VEIAGIASLKTRDSPAPAFSLMTDNLKVVLLLALAPPLLALGVWLLFRLRRTRASASAAAAST